jgi:hypothetical protein
MSSSSHTRCISPCRREGETKPGRHADLFQAVVEELPRADEQRPVILTLIGNAEKSLAMRTLFGVQSAQRPKTKQKPCEMYLHLDPGKEKTAICT